MFTVEEIAGATGGEVRGSCSGTVTGVSTDSRSAGPGDLFVPLRGPNFDGHRFVSAAAGRGVTVSLAERERLGVFPIPSGLTVILVKDTLRALGDLARFHRSRFRLEVVGVTGSNGKTTTKEMLSSILALSGPGLKTEGNLNNLIGLPQMLFKLRGDEQWAVLEMGMSELGEIDRLAEIAGPRTGIITNAFPAHLETLGSVEGVAKAKGELFLRLPAGGTAVYNAEDPLISATPVPEGVRRLGFGIAKGDVRCGAMRPKVLQGTEVELFLPDLPPVTVLLHAFGVHNVANALAAAAAAFSMGIAADVIAAGLERFRPYDRRFRVERRAGVVLIDDSYNANPASMRAALVTVREMKQGGTAIAALGDMLELGAGSREAHYELGKLAAGCVERLYLLGEMAETVADGASAAGLATGSIVVAADHESIVGDLLHRVGGGEYLLLKGSRGMQMDRIAERIRQHFPPLNDQGEQS